MAEENPFKLIHDRPNCIGCAACETISPKFWIMNDDGKADIIDSKKLDDGTEEKEITKEDYEINKEAAEACPVNVIHIKNLKTNEDII